MHIQSPSGHFTSILSVGIRGSALGPQFVAKPLAPDKPSTEGMPLSQNPSNAEKCICLSFVFNMPCHFQDIVLKIYHA
jgi:glucose-6-phosphate isomerase